MNPQRSQVRVGEPLSPPESRIQNSKIMVSAEPTEFGGAHPSITPKPPVPLPQIKDLRGRGNLSGFSDLSTNRGRT